MTKPQALEYKKRPKRRIQISMNNKLRKATIITSYERTIAVVAQNLVEN